MQCIAYRFMVGGKSLVLDTVISSMRGICLCHFINPINTFRSTLSITTPILNKFLQSQLEMLVSTLGKRCGGAARDLAA